MPKADYKPNDGKQTILPYINHQRQLARRRYRFTALVDGQFLRPPDSLECFKSLGSTLENNLERLTEGRPNWNYHAMSHGVAEGQKDRL